MNDFVGLAKRVFKNIEYYEIMKQRILSFAKD